jgi:hypothetical protein
VFLHDLPALSGKNAETTVRSAKRAGWAGLVGEPDIEAGQQVIELLHRVRPDDRAGHAGMRDLKAIGRWVIAGLPARRVG